MSSLTDLHETFIAQAERPMRFGALPVTPRTAALPIVPLDRWIDTGGALHKIYRFREPAHRDAFVVSLLSYERDVQHNAVITVTEGQVGLKLRTKDTDRVTEIDREYARYADVLYKDLVSRPSVVSSSSGEFELDDETV